MKLEENLEQVLFIINQLSINSGKPVSLNINVKMDNGKAEISTSVTHKEGKEQQDLIINSVSEHPFQKTISMTNEQEIISFINLSIKDVFSETLKRGIKAIEKEGF